MNGRLFSALSLIYLSACVPKEASLVSMPNLPAMPVVGAPQVWSPPTPTVAQIGDTPLYYKAVPGIPLISLRILIPTGSGQDPLGKWGLASLTAAMVQESAGSASTLERAAAIDRLAAKFAVSTGREWTVYALEVHRDRLNEALSLLTDSLLAPQFVEEDWNRVVLRHLTDLDSVADDNATVSARLSSLLLFGADNPYGPPVSGMRKTVEAITLEDVRSFYRQHYTRDGARIIVVGDIDPASLPTTLETSLSGWKSTGKRARVEPQMKTSPNWYFIDSPGSTQTVLRVVWPGPSGAAADSTTLDLVRVVLGGSFTSRLNQKLREEKGYTYGARIGLARFGQGGMLSAGASVRADATADALADLLGVLQTAHDGPYTEAEVDRARAQALTELVDSAESRAALAGLYSLAIESGLDPLAVAHYGSDILAIQQTAMEQSTRHWLDPSKGTVILVGDRAALLESLQQRGFRDWVFVNTDGERQ